MVRGSVYATVEDAEEAAMSASLRYTFVAFTLLTFLVGALLLIAPGRFLALIGWAPVDPILTRILGAALLALAWASEQGAQANDRTQVRELIQVEAVFCVLATVGVLRHLLGGASYPPVLWIVAAISGLYAILWVRFALWR